jgi:hypothetical protein
VSTDDKAYSAELRLNALWSHLGPAAAGTGNGQRVTQFTTTAPQVIASTTPANVNGLSVPVVAGGYLIIGTLHCIMGATADNVQVRIQGPAISHMRVQWDLVPEGTGGQSVFGARQTLIGTVTQPCTNNLIAGANFSVHFKGPVVFSAGGTMTVQAAENTNLNTWNVLDYSWWTVESAGQTS